MDYIELQLIEKEKLSRNVIKKSGRIYQYLVGQEGYDPKSSQSQKKLIDSLNYLRKKRKFRSD